MEISLFYPQNSQGWQLELKRTLQPKRLNPEKPPLLIIPGYGMNNFIFGYHPEGPSMEEFLANEGFEVWSANLRGQGAARYVGLAQSPASTNKLNPSNRQGSTHKKYGLAELSLIDVPCAIDEVLARTTTRADRVDAIGCSLGASLLYAYLAHHPKSHKLRTMTAMGGPLRWNRIHPALQLAFSSPALVGAIPFVGTRQIAKTALPLLGKYLPGALSIYMNASIVDTSKASELSKTVEAPTQHLNKQIAYWVKEKDLRVSGLNVTQALADVSLPVLCVLANRDGIVTPESALSIVDAIGTRDVTIMEIGDDTHWFAHADLFVSRLAQERVFAPLAKWLESVASSQ
jgi:pimeloyl-ACP methyl ester carboxylesterase